MGRSLKKGPIVDFKLEKKIKALSAEDRTVIKTWARYSTIFPEMVGRTLNAGDKIRIFDEEKVEEGDKK